MSDEQQAQQVQQQQNQQIFQQLAQSLYISMIPILTSDRMKDEGFKAVVDQFLQNWSAQVQETLVKQQVTVTTQLVQSVVNDFLATVNANANKVGEMAVGVKGSDADFTVTRGNGGADATV